MGAVQELVVQSRDVHFDVDAPEGRVQGTDQSHPFGSGGYSACTAVTARGVRMGVGGGVGGWVESV